KVDIDFLRGNNISSKGNEFKVVGGLKFLGLIGEDGLAKDKMRTLNVEGEPFKQALAAIVRDAYSNMFSTIKNMGTAELVDITNCFKTDYDMAPQLADEATRIFIYLAKKSGIPLSPTIEAEQPMQKQERKTVIKNPDSRSAKGKQVSDHKKPLRGSHEGEYMLIPKGMTKLEYQNKVVLLLPDVGDKAIRAQAAKMAKQLIGMYETEGN